MNVILLSGEEGCDSNADGVEMMLMLIMMMMMMMIAVLIMYGQTCLHSNDIYDDNG